MIYQCGSHLLGFFKDCPVRNKEMWGWPNPRCPWRWWNPLRQCLSPWNWVNAVTETSSWPFPLRQEDGWDFLLSLQGLCLKRYLIQKHLLMSLCPPSWSPDVPTACRALIGRLHGSWDPRPWSLDHNTLPGQETYEYPAQLWELHYLPASSWHDGKDAMLLWSK